ncbi:MAG: hypothetical protein ACW98D_18725 [Promethearchaeota archaeon]|jgi:hypothetical protein
MVTFAIHPLNFSKEYDDVSSIKKLRRKIAIDFNVKCQNIVIWDSVGKKATNSQRCLPGSKYHGGIIPIECSSEHTPTRF